jgi:hypothetical protein
LRLAALAVVVLLAILIAAPAHGIGIEPGKVFVGEYVPGGKPAVGYLTVYGEVDAVYEITYRATAINLIDGYEPAPPEVEGWVTIETPLLTVPAGGLATTSITLDAPEDAELPTRFEFRIQAKAQSDAPIQVAAQCRWLVTLKTFPVWAAVLSVAGIGMVVTGAIWRKEIGALLRPRADG